MVLVAAVTAVPALAFLFVLDQRGRLEEGATVAVRQTAPRRRAAVAVAVTVAVEDRRHPPAVRPHWWQRPRPQS